MDKKDSVLKAHDYIKKGDYAPAWELCIATLQNNTEQSDCLAMLGIICNKTKQYTEAEVYFRKCIPHHPQPHAVLTELALSLIGQSRLDEAEQLLAQSAKLNKTYSKTYIQQASLLKQQSRLDEAEQVLRQLLLIHPNSVSALNNLGTLMAEGNRLHEALELLRKAVSVKPQAYTYRNIGFIELRNNNVNEALHNFVLAHELSPQDVSILSEIGKIYFQTGRVKKAIPFFEQILTINPNNVSAAMNAAIAYCNSGVYEKAVLLFEHVLQKDKINTEAFYQLAWCKINLADWFEWNQIRSKYIRLIQADTKRSNSTTSSAFTPHYYNLPDHLQCKLMHSIKQRYDSVVANQFSFTKQRHQKIRIGYMSADFRAHALGMSVYQLFGHHSREQFEVYAFSLGKAPEGDVFHRQIMSDVDYSFDVSGLSAHAIAKLIFSNEIDILVDFGGYTRHTKPEILAMKPAPLQLILCGQPDTTALAQVDYFVADKILIDQVNREYYTEHILTLPHGFFCSPIEASSKVVTRQSLGVADDAFLFASFCSPYKYNPEMFGVWMKLLKTVDNSVLWLLSNANAFFEQNIRNEAKRYGVDAGRILFAEHIPIHDHLNRLKICDLFLDTQYYSSCSSGSHALMMGLPVLTIKGESNASRQGASVCHAAGLDDMICNTLDQYFNTALMLAQCPEKLVAIKTRLTKNRNQIAHFDLPLNVGYLEKAYHAIWQQYKKGKACSDITIKPNYLSKIMGNTIRSKIKELKSKTGLNSK